jgi:hypothetical protein
MTDWKAIAHARGLNLSPRELDAIALPLAALEESFRPLAKTLTPDLEPDIELRADSEES